MHNLNDVFKYNLHKFRIIWDRINLRQLNFFVRRGLKTSSFSRNTGHEKKEIYIY